MSKWSAFLVTAALVLCSPAADASEWLRDPISGCEIWNGADSDPSDRAVWIGSCEDGRASGNGVLVVLANGEVLGTYQGSMEDGKANGTGVLHYRTETGYDRYEGQFLDSLPHGHVVYASADGDRFEGEFKRGKL